MTEPESRLRVDYVPERCRCYPGEALTFYARVTVWSPLPGLTLHLAFPQTLALTDYRGPADLVPRVVGLDEEWRITWELDGALKAGSVFEFQVAVTVAMVLHDLNLNSVATAVVVEGEQTYRAQEVATITVAAKGRYLQYLPALYDSDELMGRFLMLFESFWGPLEQQIDQLAYYFDPRTAPADLLPWLASWLDLVLDERWPEERRRQLLLAAIRLYRQRGTRRGLAEYLQLFTGEEPEIFEHRAKNFCLGDETHLGLGVALGQRNIPHTFTVTLRLPALAGSDEATARQQEKERRRLVESIIEAEKPAHTTYLLHIIGQEREAVGRDR